MNNSQIKNTLAALFERISASLISIIVCIIIIVCGFRLDLLKSYQNLLSNIISLSSILLGALITLIGLLLGYANKAVVKRIKIRNADSLLTKYFIWPILSGFIIVVSSFILGNVFDEALIKSKIVLEVITWVWTFVLSYFISSTFRIAFLMLIILKEVFHEDVNAENSCKKDCAEEINTNDINFDEDVFKN